MSKRRSIPGIILPVALVIALAPSWLEAQERQSGAARSKAQVEKADKAEKAEKTDKADKADKAGKADKVDKADKAEKTDKAEKVEKATEAELTALEARGIDLIRDAAKEAATLSDRRSAVRVQASAADLLWKHDRAYAEGLFERAFEAAVNHYRESKDDNREQIGRNSYIGRSDIRLDVIRLVSRHDSELSRRMTDQYVIEKKREIEERAAQQPQSRGDSSLYGRGSQAGADLLLAAQSLLGTDLKLALEIATRSLAEGVSSAIPGFLAQLARRDRPAADSFYLTALERALRETPPVPGQLLLLSAYPFGENRVFVSNGSNNSSYGFPPVTDFNIDQGLIAKFLSGAALLLNRMVEINPAQSPDLAGHLNAALFAARYLEPKVAKYQPALIDDWRVMTSRLLAASQERARADIEEALQQASRDAGSDALHAGRQAPDGEGLKSLVDRAEATTDPVRRDEIYQQAAFQAARENDLARALELAGRVSDPEFRSQLLSWLHFDAAGKAIEEKRFDDARRHALEVPAIDQRAYLFFQIANAALKQKDRVLAIEMLEEAAQKASAAEASMEKLRALLAIAQLYSSIDRVRSFEILNEAIKTANKVGDYGSEQARVTRVLHRRGGGFTSTSTSNVDGFDLGKTIAAFARLDFEQTLALAQSLEPPTLRYPTVIAAAATLLEKKPQAAGN